jgi:ribosome-associated protein
MAAIPVTRTVSIDESELQFSFARSSGAGGQHVNTSSTKVELRWDVTATTALDAEQKRLVLERLGNRVTADGVLLLTSSEHRSQARNRAAAVARLRALLADALHVNPSRRPTRPTRAARRRRLEAKRRRSETKTLRRRPPPE